jgi:hypothetical protein
MDPPLDLVRERVEPASFAKPLERLAARCIVGSVCRIERCAVAIGTRPTTTRRARSAYAFNRAACE